jgi:hypothetical protein
VGSRPRGIAQIEAILDALEALLQTINAPGLAGEVTMQQRSNDTAVSAEVSRFFTSRMSSRNWLTLSSMQLSLARMRLIGSSVIWTCLLTWGRCE